MTKGLDALRASKKKPASREGYWLYYGRMNEPEWRHEALNMVWGSVAAFYRAHPEVFVGLSHER